MSGESHENQVAAFPARPGDGHKGTFGTALIIGGCRTGALCMIGAPALAARAALRTGCGLARVAAPERIIDHVIAIEPCATGIALPQDDHGQLRASECAQAIDESMNSVSTIAIGPGFGIGIEQQQIIMRLLASDELPIILDADGLNNLALVPEFACDVHAPLLMTPHPGEYQRIAKALGIDADPVAADSRAGAAAQLAQRLGSIVVLKGAGTVVSDGDRIWIDDTNEPALATGGSGDVLTGILASLAAQFFKPHMGRLTPTQLGGLDLFDIAVWGVRIHSAAGVRLAETHQAHAGMLASELCDEIPAVIAGFRSRVPGRE